MIPMEDDKIKDGEVMAVIQAKGRHLWWMQITADLLQICTSDLLDWINEMT